MTVIDAIDRFNRLARLCPSMVANEENRVRRMMEMFKPELVFNIDSGSSPPTMAANYLSRAIRAEYHLGQVQEDRAQVFKAHQEEKLKERNENRKLKKKKQQQQYQKEII